MHPLKLDLHLLSEQLQSSFECCPQVSHCVCCSSGPFGHQLFSSLWRLLIVRLLSVWFFVLIISIQHDMTPCLAAFVIEEVIAKLVCFHLGFIISSVRSSISVHFIQRIVMQIFQL